MIAVVEMLLTFMYIKTAYAWTEMISLVVHHIHPLVLPNYDTTTNETVVRMNDKNSVFNRPNLIGGEIYIRCHWYISFSNF